MIAITWQFEVKKGREAEFEDMYGVDGEWTAMNRHTRSYSWQFVSSRSEPHVTVLPHRILERDARLRAAPRLPVCGHRVSRRAERRAGRQGGADGNFYGLNVPDRTGPTWSQRR